MFRFHTIFGIVALSVASWVPGSAALAELEPEWLVSVPVGSALSAGLSGVAVDSNGTAFITGINGPSSNTDIISAAFSTDGTLMWTDVFNGPNSWHDQARGITLGPGGVVYVTGNTPGPGSYANVLLLKYDATTGERLNVVQYSSGPFTSEHGEAVATNAAGDVFVGGGTVGDGSDGITIKFNTDGQFQWNRNWDGPAAAPYSQDHVRQVQIDPDGNVVAMLDGVMSSLHPDYVVVKYDPNDGTVMWETNWGVNGGDFPVDMAIDDDGDIYVTGTGINFNDEYSTIKLRGTDGQLLWQAYDSAGIDDAARALALDGSGGVYITGSIDVDGDQSNFNDNIYTVKRSALTGERLWTHLYGETCIGCYDAPADVIVDSAGYVFVSGSTSSPPYSGNVIILALDAVTGEEIDRGIITGDANESAGAGPLRLDDAENLYMGGQFYNYNTGQVEMSVVKYPTMSGMAADVNGDGNVDVADLLMLLGSWGACADPDDCAADMNGDATVGIDDLLDLLASWN